MDPMMKSSLWQQFGAAIDMLDDAIRLCPQSLWTAQLWKDPDEPAYGQVWYVAYHTLSWLDLYLGGDYDSFVPPPPFVRGQLPNEPYTKAQILTYLRDVRSRCQSTIEAMTDERAQQICTFDWVEVPYWELQLYTMRHTQEHASQINMLLGQHDVAGLDWVTIARNGNS
ncbi:MAG: DinB family protein [Anaerolineae bacterium]|nr:DinB family protein [Anaerolineae bacterium]